MLGQTPAATTPSAGAQIGLNLVNAFVGYLGAQAQADINNSVLDSQADLLLAQAASDRARAEALAASGRAMPMWKILSISLAAGGVLLFGSALFLKKRQSRKGKR